MSDLKGRIPLLGSERKMVQGARKVGKIDPNEPVRVTVVVRPRPSLHGGKDIEAMALRPLSERRYLRHDEFEAARGAAPDDLAKVRAFAGRYSLRVEQVDASRRSVVLSGTAKQLGEAFGVELARYKHLMGEYRGRVGPIYLPPDLSPIVTAVLGLDDRPQARPNFRAAKKRAGGGVSYAPPQVAALYDFPSGLDGTGETVAIIELGGGYSTDDIQKYFAGLGIPVPTVVSSSVDGATNAPTGDPNGPDGEVMLDIEVVGSVAPKAQIVVYFAPNTDAGFLDAVTTAAHDAQHNPSVISISWGDAESNYTSQAMQAMDQAFQDAASLGITVCAASGDGGSGDGVSDGLAHVDFPASATFALGCGGTSLRSTGNAISSEVVWNDQPLDGAGGGGVSDVFPIPSWQGKAGVPPSANPGGRVGRGVPDVCGDADPATGYLVRVDGSESTIGGTSAVAPLWSGLVLLINQKLGKKAGYLNPLLYGPAAASFHDITSGNNGAYKAGPGWDACTGLGSPDGAKLAASISG